MICEAGKCCVCEKSIIRTCPTCGTKGFSNEHTQVDVTWSNGSVMPIGLCVECARTHAYATDEAKKGITEAHWKFWDAHNGIYDKSIVIV